MKVEPADRKISLLSSMVHCRCPRCRHGNMFTYDQPYHKKFMQMNEACPVCGQKFDLEVGFYYGSSYVSYALSIAISAITVLAWWLVVGISINDNSIFYWISLNAVILIVLQPLLMRLARACWLAFFVRYEANWKNSKASEPERMIEELKNAW